MSGWNSPAECPRGKLSGGEIFGGNFLGRGCLEDCPGERLDYYARLRVSKSSGDDLFHTG